MLGSRTAVDGVDVTAGEVAAALRAKVPVSTSRLSPAEFATAYRRLLDEGATHVVSVHSSAALSGTWESAVLAAQDFPHGVVRVVDSRSTAMAPGFAVLSAATGRATAAGPRRCRSCDGDVDATRTLFYVDTLEYLRRGGRIGEASALLGTPSRRSCCCSSSRARSCRSRGADLGEGGSPPRRPDLRAAGGGAVDLAVHHVAVPERAAGLADQLRAALPKVGNCYVSELGPVIGAHFCPGVLGTVVWR